MSSDGEDGVTDAERVEWSRTEACESGGVPATGPTYYGELGISVSNWDSSTYGGLADFGPEWDASLDDQIIVAERIEGGTGYVPDQSGCTGGW